VNDKNQTDQIFSTGSKLLSNSASEDQTVTQDLYLASACARGDEDAWWEFDRQHRSFIERWTRHLVRSDTDADEVFEAVYVELFGTKVVDGERQSKFRTYTGRGTLRGWLRAVILHAAVDLHRAPKIEVPMEDGNLQPPDEAPTEVDSYRGTPEKTKTSLVDQGTSNLIAFGLLMAALGWLKREKDSPPRPPFNAEYLLYMFLRRDERDAVIGDLIEAYVHIVDRFGKARADVWFYKQVVGSLWPLLKRAVLKIGALAWLGQVLRRLIS
jgi:DNA-directed RNA polymerase specialized sigma24 family protein